MAKDNDDTMLPEVKIDNKAVIDSLIVDKSQYVWDRTGNSPMIIRTDGSVVQAGNQSDDFLTPEQWLLKQAGYNPTYETIKIK